MIRMKTINKILVTLLVAVMPVMASAQVLQKAAARQEIITLNEDSEGINASTYEVFQMTDSGTYWLSVGNLGIGSDLVQLTFDPLYELFIPLGDTIDEAIETMMELKAFYNKPRLSTMEVQGCLAAGYPTDNLETVTVTSRRLMGKILSFSVKRDDFVRATFIKKSEFGALTNGLKFHKKLHPKAK